MRCAGQAMTEFAVSVAVLVLLLLAMPVVGRYHDLQMATVMGARRLAEEYAWRPPEIGPPDSLELRRDLLPPAASADQMEAEAIDSQYVRDPDLGVAGQVARTLLAPFGWSGGAGKGFDLQPGALHTARMQVPVRRPPGLPEPYADVPVVLTAHYTVLADAWMSAGPEQVEQRAGGLVLTHAAQSAAPLTALGKGLLGVIEPAFREFCPGLVDPEQVPADRLVPGGGGLGDATTAWRPAC